MLPGPRSRVARLLATPRAFSRDAPSLPDVAYPQQARLMKGARVLPREVPTSHHLLLCSASREHTFPGRKGRTILHNYRGLFCVVDRVHGTT